MSTPILATKLHIPSLRPNLVLRPRLTEQLNKNLRHNQGFGRKLTLLSAPAGFGKTTLLSEWLVDCEQPVAWLSLDGRDNETVRFFAYLVAAVQTIYPNVGDGVLVMLQSPQPLLAESILTTLLNEIAAVADDFILVLDDYHAIEADPVEEALTFLLDHLPPQMHLVIATREDPYLPLSRYRARNQMIELRASDLRFVPAEAAQFLSQTMGLNLSAEDIDTLDTRTEGWIAGLQLAAISMQNRQDVTGFIESFTGSHHYVLDYLIEEVLLQQPGSVQSFLLTTSILDQLTGSLCDAVRFGGFPSSETAVTGQDNGQMMLEMLERANLFIIPLDDERRWYRYHHLFVDLLRQRLRLTRPEHLHTLYRRASEWYEQNGYGEMAISYALRGEYFERAANLIEDQYGGNYEDIDRALMQNWLAQMPEELVCTKPHLSILDAWNLFSFGQLDAAHRRLQIAEELLTPLPDQALDSFSDTAQLSVSTQKTLVGRIAVIRSFIASYSGDMPATIRYAQDALACLPEEELVWRSGAFIALGGAYASEGNMAAAHNARTDALSTGKASGNVYILMIVNLSLAEVLRQQGRLHQVIELCRRQLKRADESSISDSAIVGWLFGIWGEVLAELNDLDEAIVQAKRGVKLTARGSDVIHIVSSKLCLIRVLFSSGDLVGAEDVIQSLENSTDEHDLPQSAIQQLSAWQARIWLAQDEMGLVSQWAATHKVNSESELLYTYEMVHIVYARILIVQGRLDEAKSLLQRLLEKAEMGGRTASAIEILLLQALADHACGQIAQAIVTLKQALTLAEPGGFVRVFVDEGAWLATLLRKMKADGERERAYAFILLAAFGRQEDRHGSPPVTHGASPQSLIEPLSQRELEVLQLISEGLTNQEIANRLYLSPNTVKVHTRNIYGKLGVHHRAEAAARARTLGLLSST